MHTRVERVGSTRPHGVRKLSSYDNAWRVRIGDYRVLYEVIDHQVLVTVTTGLIPHRSGERTLGTLDAMTNPAGPPVDGELAGVSLLGASPVRVAVLHAVLAHGEVTALELMGALQLTRNGVGRHLTELTAAGFLIERRATHPRGSGDVIYWRADRDRVAAELWRLTGQLLGYTSSTTE